MGERRNSACFILLLLFAPSGCATRPEAAQPAAGPEASTGFAEIHVIARGWHTDIGLPAAAFGPALAGLARDFPNARHLVFGFGDRGYLLDRAPSPVRTLLALLPGPGAVLLTALASPPEAAFGAANVVALPLSRTEFERLEMFIAGSLDWARRDERMGRLQPIAEGPYPGSVFHASSMTYSATYTCNTWTAEALAVAGLPVSATGILFTVQIMAQAQRAAALRRAAGT